MKTKLFILTLLLLGFASAGHAQAAACPVTVTDVRNIENAMYVFFQNDESRTITSYQFRFIFVDLRGKEHAFPLAAGATGAVQPGSGGRVKLASSQTMQYLFPAANAYLVKATFEDGTTWNDDGTHACGATSWQE